MFQLLFDPRHNVLMTRFHGVYVPDDIALRDLAVARFVAEHGLARGILDYTDVEAIDVPIDLVVRRGSGQPLLPGQTRVIVAPASQTWEMCQVIAALQRYSRKVEPLVVRSRDEAFRVLEIDEPRFEPLCGGGYSQKDDALVTALGRIDEAASAADNGRDQRRRIRAKMLRLFDLVSVDPAAKPQAAATITFSDVLNAALAHTRVADENLRATCGRCKAPMALSACQILPGRSTLYACSICQDPMIELTPADRAGDAGSYALGGFQVRMSVDVDCLGVTLPRTQAEPLHPPAGR